MQKVFEIDATGNGLFKFDSTIKGRQGERIELNRNKENKAGLLQPALQMSILSTLSFLSLCFFYIHNLPPQIVTAYS